MSVAPNQPDQFPLHRNPELAQAPFDREWDELILRRLASGQLNASRAYEYCGALTKPTESDDEPIQMLQWLNRLDARGQPISQPLNVADLESIRENDVMVILAGWTNARKITRNTRKERMLASVLIDRIQQELVGVAFSGGGVRSASFNLGVLQALAEKDVLKNVDYLSTVSGGGYIGSFFTGLLHNMARRGENASPKELLVAEKGQQTPIAQKLIRGGQYLNQPKLFLNRFLIGWFWVNLVFWSGYFLLCLGLAYAWRLLDVHPVHTFILWMTFDGCLDYVRPFLPAMVFFVAWLVCWSALYWNWFMAPRPILRGTVDLVVLGVLAGLAIVYDKGVVFRCDTRCLACLWLLIVAMSFLVMNWDGFRDVLYRSCIWIFVLAVVSLLIGTAVWLSTPVINVASSTSGSVATDMSDYLTRQSNLIVPLLIILAACLLPFLWPGRLLHSGQASKGSWEGVVFKISTYALLGGIPLASVMLTARHNVSGEADMATRQVVNTDIKDWPRFFTRLRSEKSTNQNTPATYFLHQLEVKAFDGSDQGNEMFQFLTIDSAESLNEIEKRFSPSKDMKNVKWNEWHEIETKREKIAGAIDDVLSWTGLAEDLTKLDGKLDKPEEEEKEKAELASGRPLPYSLRKRTQLEAAEKKRLKEYLDLHKLGLLPEGHVKDMNYLLLRAFYPDELWPRTMPRRSVTVNADQTWRLHAMGWVLGVFLLSALLVNLNATSLHWFYYEQLRQAYLKIAPTDESHVKLHQLENTMQGGPYHLLSATVDLGSEHRNDLFSVQTFLFSKHYCGCPTLGYEPSSTYSNGEVDLATAMAISGAAVTPMRINNPLVAILMSLMNLRLGQWFVRPNGKADFINNIHFIGLLIDRVRGWWSADGQRRFYFLSDGGHEENLGIEPLLRRRCRLIVASDAGQDGDHNFDDFSKLYRRMRLRGIQFCDPQTGNPLSLELLEKKKNETRVQGNFIVAKFIYPDGLEGMLVYLKPCFSSQLKEEIDLANFKKHYPAFPHDPTSDVTFQPDQVESYRQLGEAIGKRLVDKALKLHAALEGGLPFTHAMEPSEPEGRSGAASERPSSPGNVEKT